MKKKCCQGFKRLLRESCLVKDQRIYWYGLKYNMSASVSLSSWATAPSTWLKDGVMIYILHYTDRTCRHIVQFEWDYVKLIIDTRLRWLWSVTVSQSLILSAKSKSPINSFRWLDTKLYCRLINGRSESDRSCVGLLKQFQLSKWRISSSSWTFSSTPKSHTNVRVRRE